MWNLPEPGIEPVSPALTGGFLSTVLPGKSCLISFDILTTSFCKKSFLSWLFPLQSSPSELLRGCLLGLNPQRVCQINQNSQLSTLDSPSPCLWKLSPEIYWGVWVFEHGSLFSWLGPCDKPFSAWNSKVSVSLAPLCLGHRNLGSTTQSMAKH